MNKCIVVTGWRGPLTNAQRVYVEEVLIAVMAELDGVDRVITGCAAGVDAVARRSHEWSRARVDTYRADWKGLGRAAGPARNKIMIGAARSADLATVIAFPHPTESKGTRNCIGHAQDAGLKVRVFPIPLEKS